MKKFNALLLLSLTSLMVFTACSGTPTYVGEDELGGGQVDNETGTSNTDVSDLKVYLQELSQFRNYTYTTEYNYIDSNGVSHSQTVVDYYGDHFFYEDNLPYGHGEKSVYILSGFLRLTREEAMAIRWHMGFSGDEDKRLVGQAFQQYPLAFALSVADMEATYFLEKDEA